MILILNLCEDSLSKYEFVDPIVRVVKNCVDKKDIVVKHFLDIVDEDLQKADRIILSGSPFGEIKYIECIDKLEWLLKIEKPVLGICGGMQTICKLYDCEFLKGKEEIGIVKVIVEKNSILTKAREVDAYALHTYSVEKSDKIEVLGSSKECIHMIKVIGKEIYGTLFHPEVRNPEIIENFIK